MAPMPRVAPPPPPPPPPPPVMAPASPGMQPGSPATVAPRTTRNPDTSSPAPQAPAQATTGGSTTGGSTTGSTTGKVPDNNSPIPRDRAPAPTGNTTGNTTGGTTGRAAPVATPVASSIDRSTAVASASRGLLPVRDVAIVSTGGGKQTQVRSNDKGQFSLGPLAAGVHDVTLSLGDLQRALPDGGTKRRLPSVTVSLVIPSAGGGTRGNLVVHTYSRVDPKKDIRPKITVPRDGGGTIVDWNDGTPPVNVVRDGWPVDVGGGGRTPVDTIGTVSFVPKFQKMQFMQQNPCQPWWQCMPPPDPDPPMDDPWTEVLPETDPPPEDPIIEIVDDLPDPDPPRDPPRDPPKIGDKGTFDLGPLPLQGTRLISLTLPQSGKVVTEPPKPPVKVALLLPTDARAALQAMNAGGRPPLPGEQDRLFLVEHIYAPDTTGQTIRVKVTLAPDGNGVLVDWGDGTPVTNVRRDGKPIAAASVDHEAVGRILFVAAKKN